MSYTYLVSSNYTKFFLILKDFFPLGSLEFSRYAIKYRLKEMVLSLHFSLVGGILGLKKGQPFMDEEVRDPVCLCISSDPGRSWMVSPLQAPSHLVYPDSCPGSTVRPLHPLASLPHNFLFSSQSCFRPIHLSYCWVSREDSLTSILLSNVDQQRNRGKVPRGQRFFLLGSRK